MWHRRIEWIEPIEAAARLATLPGLCLLDSAMAHPTLGRYSLLAADPFGVFVARGGTAFWNEVAEAGTPLEALRRRLAHHACPTIPGLPPFQGGAVGSVAYEFGWTLEGREPPAAPRGDDIHLAFHDIVLAFDHAENACWLIASGFPATGTARRRRAEARLDAFMAALACPRPSDRRSSQPNSDTVWYPTISRDLYRGQVERVKAFIAAGDIYQANIARRFLADLPPDTEPLALYRALREANPAPFCAYLDEGARHVLSTSPELFLRLRGRRVETRPIKGTAKRGVDDVADRAAAEALLASRKDRAENVMIVDLLRNDLSRVCVPASIEVPQLCGLESYAGLHHLVSVVTGELDPDRDAHDLLAATFPGGSITGAPKLRAMEIIAELEGVSRGLYCGAIGCFGFDGSVDLNIAIRTLVVEGATMDLRTGGGITILSDADVEYEETLTKAQRIFEAFAAKAGRPRPVVPVMILVIDNYDSFVHNVARYLTLLGETTMVVRNDALGLDDVVALRPEAIVISPGPCTPTEAGISSLVIQRLSGAIPILGVCLGHQCIGAVYGGRMARARYPMHGLSSDIRHTGAGLFAGLPSPLPVGRYHSLIVEATDAMDQVLTIDATSPEGEIMALSHRSHPTYGVQFHPESVLTPSGMTVLGTFLARATTWRQRSATHALA